MTSDRKTAIQIDSVSYAYPTVETDPDVSAKDQPVDRLALDHLSFEIDRGEFFGLVGPVGAGKTTLCLSLLGLVPHSTGGAFGGNVTIEGHNTRQSRPSDLARLIGYVPQDPESAIITSRVEDEVAFGLESLNVPFDRMRERVDWALGLVGLLDLRRRSPARLSGGEQQRLLLASALATRPRILVLDEPTANLDPEAAKSLYSTLISLQAELGLTIFLVESDPRLLLQVASRVGVLDEGRLIALGAPERLIEEAVLQPAGKTIFRLPDLAVIAKRLGVATKSGSLPVSVEAADAAISLARPDLGAGLAKISSIKTIPQVSPKSQILLEFENVSFAYSSGKEVLHSVSFSLVAGECKALLGRNGSGKTTLAKHAIGLHRPKSGRVLVLGETAIGQSIDSLARSVGFVFQNPDHELFARSVEEELAFGPTQLDLSTSEVRERVDEVCDLLGLGAYRGVPPATLGHGLRRAVGLGAVLTLRPRVLVLDEPFTSLDPRLADRVIGGLKTLRSNGLGILLISHNVPALCELADSAAVLDSGRLIAERSLFELLADSALLRRAGLIRPEVTELYYRLVGEDRTGGDPPVNLTAFLSLIDRVKAPGNVSEKGQ